MTTTKKAMSKNLRSGQLLQVTAEEHIQLYVDGTVENNQVKDLILELKPGQILMYLKREWVKNVECTLYFLIEDRVYAKRFVGNEKALVKQSIDDFLQKTHKPI